MPYCRRVSYYAPVIHEPGRLGELARLFLRLGATSFGGPAVHVAMMEEEVVRRRNWLRREEFFDLLSATNLIPGPNSTEMAIHVGYRRAGLPGLLVAGVAFIAPAVVLVWILAWGYTQYGRLPEVAAVFAGIKPVVLVLLLRALWSLGPGALKNAPLVAAACAALAMLLYGIDEIAVLVIAGAAMAASLQTARSRGAWFAAAPALAPSAVAGTSAAFQLSTLFFAFLKIGTVLFGSGYVLVAFLREEFVVKLRWLAESQLFDAVAAGQMTPGPLFATATFVGYLVGGHAGAALATAGIFLPAFVFVWLSGPLVAALRRSPAAGAFLDGVNAASLALMVIVSWQFARDALRGPMAAALALATILVLWRSRVNSGWLILGGALVGFFFGG